jgi:predicted dinucleotide-binding enzyme
MTKTLGIIGAGNIGQALARHALRGGRHVVVANSRGPDSLHGLVAELGDGVTAGTVEQAADSDLVAIAVPWLAIPEAVAGVDWSGRIVIDTTNPIISADFEVADLGGRTSSEVVADLVPGARLVKAANTLLAAQLAADPHEGNGRRVLTLAGDDAAAKTAVAELLESAGFATIDLGGLIVGGYMQQFPGGVFPTRNLLQFEQAA